MKAKGWLLGILSTALIFVVTYMFWATVDEKLKARYPETTEVTNDEIEKGKLVEDTTVQFEELDSGTEDEENIESNYSEGYNPVSETDGEELEEIQPIIITDTVVY